MTSRRRSILKGGAVLAAATLVSTRGLAGYEPTGIDFNRAHRDVQLNLLDQFGQLGYTPVLAAPIVTGNERFNGGLRFDDTGVADHPSRILIQHCARLEDIEKRARRDVLPFFHIFRCNRPQDHKPQQSLAQVLAYLTGPFGIDVSRLALVGAPLLEDYAPVLKRAQIETGRQVYLREDSEARASSDGSGYWRFPGDENADAFATAGLYCWIGDGAPKPIAQYPPSEDWTEIGEAILDDRDTVGFVLGTERLTLALTGTMPTWKQQLTLLFEAIEKDGAGAVAPSGWEEFAKG